MRLALSVIVALLVGCLVETFTDGKGGVVYECVSPAGDKVEWCADIDAAQLGEETGRTCERSDRLWPWIANAFDNGCVYSCKPHSGCNATHGCYCQ